MKHGLPLVFLTAAQAVHANQTEIQALEGAEAVPGSRVGEGAAMGGDWAILGAYRESEGLTEGAAYAFKYVNGVYVQQQRIVPEEETEYALFGSRMVIEGNTLAVVSRRSAPRDIESKIHMFVLDDDAWVHSQVITPDDTEALGRTIVSIDMSGETMVGGAPSSESTSPGQTGKIHVYRRVNGVWSEDVQLFSPEAFYSYSFGTSVGIAGDTIVVGAPGPDTADAGRAYVFTRTSGTWSYSGTLDPGVSVSHYYGWALALCGPRAAIVEQDATYLYLKSGGLWELEDIVYPVDPNPGFHHTAKFSEQVVLTPSLLAVQVIGHTRLDLQAGEAVYVYLPEDGGWEQSVELVPSIYEYAHPDEFGNGLAAVGGTVLVGAPGTYASEPGGEDDIGRGFVYAIDGVPAPISGDVNGDLVANAADIQAVINAVLGSGSVSGADANADGQVDALDIQSVVNLVLGA